jgi:seryl-tRNA synthetase
MLDIRLFRDDPDRVREGLASKNEDPGVVDRVLELDRDRRAVIAEADELKRLRKEESKKIGARMKAGEDTSAIQAQMRDMGDRIKSLDERLHQIETDVLDQLLRIPNLPHSTVPKGGGPEDNVVVRTHGEPVEHSFEALAHWDLGERLGILDIPRAAKVSGSGFYALRGAGARLERILIHWMLDTHVAEHGYTEWLPPFLVKRETMVGTSQLPKFEDDMYGTDKEDDLFLVPTAEVPVTNLHRDEILGPLEVPRRYVAHTPCFRREAGSYGKEVRGITRVHQFNKVEMVHYALPGKSYEHLEELTGHAEVLLQRLGLAYRVLELCTGDLSFGAAKCYDIEVWAPGMKQWLEVSSCSNFEDFQARRANLRFRRAQGEKPEYVHTLNGSGLALPRCMIAFLETHQQPDGSVRIPEALRQRFGADAIGPA